MTITPETVRDLREKTGAGMMDCKRALQDSNGDLEKAIDHLRKKGLATAAKKSGRVAAEGTIADAVSSDGKFHTLVEVNCETDFVTKTEDFKKYAACVAGLIIDSKPGSIDLLHGLKIEGKNVKDYQTELVAKIGENINVRRFETIAYNGTEKVSKYIHPGSKIAVLVLFDDPNSKLDAQLAKEIAMHVAAMSPSYIGRIDVPADVITREKAIFKEQMADQKKPAEILEKIIEGKLAKHMSEICLEDQIFVKDPDGKTSVKNTLKKIDPGIKIKKFIRLQVGEGIEKKKADLASEIAEMIK